MSTKGFEDWTMADVERISHGRGVRGPIQIQPDAPKPSPPAKPQRGHKYRAQACIVTADRTLFTKQDICNAAVAYKINLPRGATPLKELARSVGVIGDWFASLKEAKRWIQLLELQAAGAIRELQRQVPYSLLVNDTKIASWIADFTYEEFYDNEWLKVREDSKGVRTPEYQLKKKHAEAQYGWQIRET